jgi:hypothetical protein
MNARERFRAVTHFHPADAVPNGEMCFWDATLISPAMFRIFMHYLEGKRRMLS